MIIFNKHKSAYVITAMLAVLCFLGVHVTDALAGSYSSMPYDSGWRYYSGVETAEASVSEPFSFADIDSIMNFSDKPFTNDAYKKTYTENLSFVYGTYSSDVYRGYAYKDIFSSDSEIVLFFTPYLTSEQRTAVNSAFGQNYSAGTGGFFVLCKTQFHMSTSGYQVYNSGLQGKNDSGIYTSSTFSYKGSSYYYMFVRLGQPYCAVNTGKMPVFDDFDNALTYMITGVGTPTWQGRKVEGFDSDSVYFDEFKITTHDSNAFSAFYFDFSYSIPQELLQNANSLYLDIDSTYDFTGNLLADAIRVPRQNYGVNRIDLLEYPSGFKLYLGDIQAIQNFIGDIPVASDIAKRQVLGSEALIDFSLLSVSGLGGNTMGRITNSNLFLDCYIVAEGICGEEHSQIFDLLNGGGSYYSSHCDKDGNYMPNDDYTNNGYYYTEVGTDAAGNETHTYYYYGDDNSCHQITAEDSYNNSYSGTVDTDIGIGGGGGGSASGDNSNNNVNNPTFNNNNNVSVVVEGDSINNDVDNIINNDTSNSKENSDSFIGKFLGFFNLLENNSFLSILGKLFGWLPAPVYGILTGSIGIVAGVSVFRFFRK